MNCPICENKMVLNQTAGRAHKALECSNCNFVIFFKGIPELDIEAV